MYEITAEKKVLSTANILHKVTNDISLNEVKAILKTYDSESLFYTPTPGLYWLRKGNKQPVNLSTEQDFEACKNEYQCQNLRIACRAISLSGKKGWAQLGCHILRDKISCGHRLDCISVFDMVFDLKFRKQATSLQ